MIRIGTAGWSYPTGQGKWTGIFYPPDRKVDPLEFYARFFATVEVNSTFYRPIAPNVARNWAAKTPSDFRFAVKLYQKFTHPKMFEDATGETARIAAADLEEFEASVAPLAEAGKLGPLLAQFPPSFKHEPATVAYLEELATRLAAYQLVVELRHRSWTEAPATAEALRAHDVSWVHIDEPRVADSGGRVPRTGPIAYFRFHGRNFKDWWRGDRETRYNYLYSPGEQAALAQQITDVAGTASDSYVAYNNHYRGKAVANALQMKLILGQEVPPDIPAPLLGEYPDLAKLVEREAAER